MCTATLADFHMFRRRRTSACPIGTSKRIYSEFWNLKRAMFPALTPFQKFDLKALRTPVPFGRSSSTASLEFVEIFSKMGAIDHQP